MLIGSSLAGWNLVARKYRVGLFGRGRDWDSLLSRILRHNVRLYEAEWGGEDKVGTRENGGKTREIRQGAENESRTNRWKRGRWRGEEREQKKRGREEARIE